SGAYYELEKKNAYVMDFFNTFSTNIYQPVHHPRPAISASAFTGNDLDAPALQGRIRLRSIAVGDTLSFLDDTIQATIGARYQNLYTQDLAYNTGEPSEPYDESRLSPAFGLVFSLTPEWSLYVNYIESLTPGSTAPGTA